MIDAGEAICRGAVKMALCCSDFNAGKLRTPIVIQEYADSPDGMGGVVKTWVPVLTVRSMWTHGSMYERLQAMKLNAGVLHRVYIRYSSVPTAKHRIFYKGQAYQIRGVVDIEERGRWLELSVEEGQPT